MPCIGVAGRRGSTGRGQVDTTLESMSGLGYSLNILPLVSVYVSSERDYSTTIFSIYTHSVCIYTYVNHLAVLLLARFL